LIGSVPVSLFGGGNPRSRLVPGIRVEAELEATRRDSVLIEVPTKYGEGPPCVDNNLKVDYFPTST